MSIVSVHARLTPLASGYSGLRRTGPVPKVFERMAVGTRGAITVLDTSKALHQPILQALEPQETRILQMEGLLLEYYHGRKDIYYGARLTDSEEDIFQGAKAALLDPGNQIGRDLIFRLMGIKTNGVNELTTKECLELGGWLKWYRFVKGIFLFDISSITVVDSEGIVVSREDQKTKDGWDIKISTGDLTRMANHAWINERVLSEPRINPEA